MFKQARAPLEYGGVVVVAATLLTVTTGLDPKLLTELLFNGSIFCEKHAADEGNEAGDHCPIIHPA